MRDRL
ncbi:hypothetical protein CPC698_0655A, partial [Chlamydia psittaci C6/98]